MKQFLIRIILGAIALPLLCSSWMTPYPAVSQPDEHPVNMVTLTSHDRVAMTSHQSVEHDRQSELSWLSLPIVFHLHRSQAWRSPTQLTAVLAETQRIFNQAHIELQPTFVQTEAATADIDVYLVPQIWHRGHRINGISYPNRDKEIYVRDNVSLMKVADQRPQGPLPTPDYAHQIEALTDVWVSTSEAEQARTIAHEISHQLGLQHRPEWIFLQASGTTGWYLDRDEITRMRAIAQVRTEDVVL
ncbi:MAG: hypothetical protein AAF327_18390 [Cyanobacteria bacterium P01_A01_bin.37]